MSAVVAVSACHKKMGDYDFDCVGHPYLEAVVRGAGCLPLMVPAMGSELCLESLLSRVDGLLLTGSLSNVEPIHYSGNPSKPGTEHDPRRDGTTLPLIREVVKRGMPLLAICRGHQELNVALGGTLHQELHLVEGRFDHRSDQTLPFRDRYRQRHPITLSSDGRLRGITGRDTLQVNSLHIQAVDRLSPLLTAEAFAEDGTVEAVRVTEARSFALGVQWHPEWLLDDCEASRALFAAFGDACRESSRLRD